jgi:hypothetical protein
LLSLVAGCTVVHALVAAGIADILNEPDAASKAVSRQAPHAVQVRSIALEPSVGQEAMAAHEPAQADTLQPAAAPVAAPVKPGTRRYFDASDVDAPAAPQPDWQVDIDQLVASGVRRLDFEVLVSERGVAERCRILQMEPPKALPSSVVAARLCTTRMTPAMRQGAPVASVRRIELMLAE